MDKIKINLCFLHICNEVYSNSSNGATLSFFHKYATQCEPAVPAVKTSVVAVAKNT